MPERTFCPPVVQWGPTTPDVFLILLTARCRGFSTHGCFHAELDRGRAACSIVGGPPKIWVGARGGI